MWLFDNKGNTSQKEVRTEEDRLSEQIDQLERQIASVYEQIGKEYYESDPKGSLSDSMESCFREVEEKKGSIQELTDQIRTIKGITSCEHCGADVLVTDTFCASCGKRIISEIKVSSSGGRCSSCGHEIQPGQQFCSTCGAKVTISECFEEELESEKTKVLPPKEMDAEDVSEKEAEKTGEDLDDTEDVWEKETVEGASASQKRLCPNCGKELQEGILFCIFCGEPVEASAEQAPIAAAPSANSFCANCGERLDPGDTFCANCGQKV